MKISKEFGFKYSEYASKEELSSENALLVSKAIDAQKSSYSPYSKFSVGAALILDNGEIIQGSNQENGAYPSGLCAERVAIFYAGAKHPGVAIRAIAISASFNGQLTDEPVPPCGACRQVMIESRNIGQKPIKVLLVGRNKIFEVEDVTFLLPFNFSNANEAAK